MEGNLASLALSMLDARGRSTSMNFDMETSRRTPHRVEQFSTQRPHSKQASRSTRVFVFVSRGLIAFPPHLGHVDTRSLNSIEIDVVITIRTTRDVTLLAHALAHVAIRASMIAHEDDLRNRAKNASTMPITTIKGVSANNMRAVYGLKSSLKGSS